ncbi:MAG: tetratricopeptide repeat protein [Oscillatoria princeps RMCB-10]|jgi:tetratricopeptide (TPR) repeat protein|nr:tetratricopeptide repeat protein [Oscillatoria princeps RMCB-10]
MATQRPTQPSKHRTQDYFWGVLLIGLPLASLLLANLPSAKRFWNGSWANPSPAGLNPAYRYPFSESLESQASPKLSLQQEIAFYQHRLSLDPQSGLNRAALAQAYLKMARATGESSWYLLAQQAAERSLASLPFDNTGALLALARIAEARHDFPTALRLAEQAGFRNEDALAIKVTSNLAAGKVDEAARSAEALVRRIPNLGTLTLRALTHQAQGKDAEALRDFQQALAAEEPGELGSSARTRTLLGRYWAKRGQLAEAKALYQEALRLAPRNSLALAHLAELETRLGQYREAESHYAQIVTYSNGAATVYDHIVDRGMARLKELQGDSKAAKQWQDRAEAILRQQTAGEKGSNFGHRRELAHLLLERGRPQDVGEALTLMRAEVKIRQDAQTLDTLAWALSRLGRWQEARTAMRSALRWGVRDAGMFYRAGTVEKALGNESAARAYFQQALDTDPTFDEQARRALGLGL